MSTASDNFNNQLKATYAACPAAFYVPNTAAPEEWIISCGGMPGTKSAGDAVWFESDAQFRVSVGGNRAGKTTKLILEMGSMGIGLRPWYPPDSPWRTRGLKTKSCLKRGGQMRMRYVMPAFRTHGPEVEKELLVWWPQSMWKVTARDKDKNITAIKWYTGATTQFMSHHQNVADYEGIEADANFYDEPPPEEYFTALERGVVSTGGRSMLGATLLNSAGWFWELIDSQKDDVHDPDDVLITWHSIWDNTAENGGCPSQTVENVRRWLTIKIRNDEERRAREHGYPMNIGGLVLSGITKERIVSPHEFPQNSIIISAIDPAGSKPFAVAWMAFWPNHDGGFDGTVFDELWDVGRKDDLKAFAEYFEMKESGLCEPYHPSRSSLILIDPFANEPQKADKYGRTMKQILSEEYGIHTQEVDRSGKRARLLQTNSRFASGQYTCWNTLERFHSERRKWSWDVKDASKKLTTGIDDVCDCVSYIDSADPGQFFKRQNVWTPPGYSDAGREKINGKVVSRGRRRN